MILHNRYHLKDGDGINPTYIGRGTRWGNPFPVTDELPRGEAAAKFRRMMARKLAGRDRDTVGMIMSLAGVEHISCSCKPLACHGDVYVEIWDIIRNSESKNVIEGIRTWVKANGFPATISTDGKDHINVYSKGVTKLGRKLTNMSNLPVHIPGVGQFMSMEGYWHYLKTGSKYLEFMDMNGFEAKKFGSTKDKIIRPDFQDKIRYALWLRFEQNPTLKEQFVKSTLPLVHYYHYGNEDITVTYPPFDWLTNELILLRDLYQGTKKACVIAGSRDITDIEVVNEAIKASGYEFDVVVCGKAKGVDTLGEQWGKANGKQIRYFEPNWDHFGKRAGMLRNIEMGTFAHMAVVTIKNNSKGSVQMYEHMQKLGKPVHRVDVTNHQE